MKTQDLKIGDTVNVRYKSIMRGDRVRMLNNLTLVQIYPQRECETASGTKYTVTPMKFTQEQKNGKIKEFHLCDRDILVAYIVK